MEGVTVRFWEAHFIHFARSTLGFGIRFLMWWNWSGLFVPMKESMSTFPNAGENNSVREIIPLHPPTHPPPLLLQLYRSTLKMKVLFFFRPFLWFPLSCRLFCRPLNIHWPRCHISALSLDAAMARLLMPSASSNIALARFPWIPSPWIPSPWILISKESIAVVEIHFFEDIGGVLGAHK